MRCDVIAEGIILAAKELDLQIPLIVRLQGTKEHEAKELIRNSKMKIFAYDNLDEGESPRGLLLMLSFLVDVLTDLVLLALTQPPLPPSRPPSKLPNRVSSYPLFASISWAAPALATMRLSLPSPLLGRHLSPFSLCVPPVCFLFSSLPSARRPGSRHRVVYLDRNAKDILDKVINMKGAMRE